MHSALEDVYLRKSEFNADLYEDVYNAHITFLTQIQNASAAKYHRMMADLYSAAS
jgi:hypothetical protein